MLASDPIDRPAPVDRAARLQRELRAAIERYGRWDDGGLSGRADWVETVERVSRAPTEAIASLFGVSRAEAMSLWLRFQSASGDALAALNRLADSSQPERVEAAALASRLARALVRLGGAPIPRTGSNKEGGQR